MTLTWLVRRDGVVVNTLAFRPRGPGFNSLSDRTLPSRSSCGQAVSSQLPWRTYEAVLEGWDPRFLFTVCLTLIALLYMSAIYVYHDVCLFAPTAVCQCYLLKERFFFNSKFNILNSLHIIANIHIIIFEWDYLFAKTWNTDWHILFYYFESSPFMVVLSVCPSVCLPV